MKKKKKVNIITDVILIMLLVIMGFSGYKLYTIYNDYAEAKNTYDDLRGEIKYKPSKKEIEEQNSLDIDWKRLKEINPDIIGWIYCEDTPIDYPILQGKDNDYYLYKLYTHEYSIAGSIFADYNCLNPFNGDMTILYGHRMKDLSMFATLKYYFWEDFFNDHPTMEIYTPEKNYTLELFSAKEVGDMNYYRYNFSSPGDKDEYIRKITTTNEMIGYDNRVKVNAEDKLVMMSTCTSRLDNNRLVVWGRLVDKVI